jgi:hypothetical protein
MKKLLLILYSLVSLHSTGQEKDFAYSLNSIATRLPAKIINGDTVGIVNMDAILILSDRNFIDYSEALKYFSLKRDVKAAYPYAILIQATFNQCVETVNTMTSEKEKKKYLKEMEKQLKEQYTQELKNLTISQGRLLIKLIDRQTGNTSYAVVKQLKGSFCAFMWQAVACLFGDNMKSKYDPEGEDREVEHIIQLIEAGAI